MAKTAKKSVKKSAKKSVRKGASSASTAPASGRDGRGKRLVIVESPAKAKTINRYLGKDYIVKASMGHVRDLPTKEIGVDVENRFEPTYEPLPGRRKVLAELKKYAKAASEVFLATDLDREGEAIAWHLAESLPQSAECFRRVVFNEITAAAIREAFADPHQIDMHKVNAQQARRILDRIVGYEVSPLLWKKVARGLSAGRVQSVAVRLIVDREREIQAFDPEEYWRIGAVFTSNLGAAAKLGEQWEAFLAQRDEKGNGPTREAQQHFLSEHGGFRAELVKWKGERFSTDDAKTVTEVVKALGITVAEVERTEDPSGKGPAAHRVRIATKIDQSPATFQIADLSRRQRRVNPPAPFTTAAMQQAAAVQLHFSASRTMRVAQQLYEGIDVPGEGGVGLITYMRTDSTQLSRDATDQVRGFIQDTFGQKYLPEKPRSYAAAKRAQEAHEAIRPTDAARTPDKLRGSLSNEQFRLYDLIWKRFVACQMNPAVWQVTEAAIVAETSKGKAEFKSLGRQLEFDGFLKVAGPPRGGDQILPDLDVGQPVAPADVQPTQHFTQAPPRYTEASLVKALEADGIGRPSTYASIIQTIQSRRYVELIDRSFHPTDMGTVVTDKLVKHLPDVFDVRFTAHMEDQLDHVEDGSADWVAVLKEFYGPFSADLKRAAEEMVHAKAESEPSDYVCENCRKPMVYKFSRNGRYLACTGYPDCKTTHPVDKEGKKVERQVVDVACPKCGEALILRKGRFGPFLSCSKYPECDGVVNLDKKGFIKPPSAPPLQVDAPCPKCQAPLNLRRSKRGPWLSCSKYPKCRGRQGWKALPPDQQKDLELKLLNHEKEHPQPVIKKLDGTAVGDEHTPAVLADEEKAPA